MTRNSNAFDDREASDQEVKSALADLIADKRFRATERGRAILSYIADLHFSGSSEGVKGYSIAIDVLGRPDSFDPSTDPIVRIEISRLRAALVQYYEAFGKEKPIEIELPKGKYTLAFNRRAATDIPVSEEPFVGEPIPPPLKPPLKLRLRLKYMDLAVAGFVLFISFTLVYFMTNRSVDTVKPTVAIDFRAEDPAFEVEAENVRDSLLIALGNFHTLALRSDDSGSVDPQMRFPAYTVRMRYRVEGDIRSIWWQVNDEVKNVIVSSGVEEASGIGQSSVHVRSALSSALSQKLAASTGVINTRLAADVKGSFIGNVCVLKAEISLAKGQALSDNETCLEQTLKSDPRQSDAMAALSRVLVNANAALVSKDVLDRSLELAQNAASIAPGSDRAEFALMEANFRKGRIDEALEAGKRAVSLNPNNLEAKAMLASVLFANENWDQAVALIDENSQTDRTLALKARTVLALDAARRGDWHNVLLRANQLPPQNVFATGFRLAALVQLRPSEAQNELRDATRSNPNLREIVGEKLAAMSVPNIVTNVIIDQIQVGQTKTQPDKLTVKN
ncbi:tetratricopeptide repeat protein [Ochrobactrum sp. Q0168]|uniref:tetratricopeptide repeat protein n=1 Tax=Ochrobactrum sp. Q0168 TaxID=2793241 RepID=UPI0018EC36BE|nr:tetratricopeptide repeat protein [Ochrobactrum sp. Q0168]